MPSKGKIMNTEKQKLENVLGSEELKIFNTAIGTGILDNYREEDLKYDKIIIMSDADVDGYHIRTLWMTYIYRYMRPLIANGHLYIALPPLYKVYKHDKKGEIIKYAYSDEELEKVKKEVGKGALLQRYKPWWDQAARENLRINQKLFMMVGDISYKNLGATNAMMFNKSLFDSIGLEYPYQLVYDNAWTFDKFAEYAQRGTTDINGDGKIAFADDQIGYVTDEWIGPIQVLYSGNQRIVQKDENDLPYLSLNTDLTVEIYDKFFALIDSDAGHCAAWEGLDSSVASATGIYGKFINNKALFLDTNIRGTVFLRNMDANFGIVPWPKFNETIDKYYANVDAGCNLIIVPITAGDAERTSIILEALCAEGYKSVVPAYFGVALATKYARDEESAKMLDIVKAGRVYDLGYYDNTLGVMNSIGENMFTTKSRDFTSLYAKNEKVANAQLEKIIKAYSD
jgi:5S rRNA maturation endonuclease (ribonuclease M5)